MEVKNGITKNSCMKVDTRTGYTLYNSCIFKQKTRADTKHAAEPRSGMVCLFSLTLACITETRTDLTMSFNWIDHFLD